MSSNIHYSLEALAHSAMTRPSKYMEKWCYEFGLILKALEAVWKNTGDKKYFQFIQSNIDRFVNEDGSIQNYSMTELNLDHINPGHVLLTLYCETMDKKYKLAADQLRNQLNVQPRNRQGGFWHKGIYPHQMWLDGLYMSSPFYARYSKIFKQEDAFEDISRQIILMSENMTDPKTGLMYHAWDESKGMKWADDKTGCSPHFWGRAMGWYLMALVDILDFFPHDYAMKKPLIDILQNLVPSLLEYQDTKTGVWFQIVDQGSKNGNYLEASASCMYTYAIAKGIRMGYLSQNYDTALKTAFSGIENTFLEIDNTGLVRLKNVCSVAGLGGNPYRDGSFSYYISEPITSDDYKGFGPLILAFSERND